MERTVTFNTFGRVRTGRALRLKDGRLAMITYTGFDSTNQPVVMYHRDGKPLADFLADFLNKPELNNDCLSSN